jgi:hypothetical protein
MKKLYTLTFMMFLFVSVFAQSGNTRFTLSAVQDLDYITLNGRTYTADRFNNLIQYAGLPAGRYTIRVYGTNKMQYNTRNNRNQSSVLIFEDVIQLRKGYHTDMFINRFGRAQTDYERLVYRNNNWDYNTQVYNQNTSWNTYRTPMNADRFSTFRNTVKKAAFDDTRKEIVRQAKVDNAFSTDQVVALLGDFSFEQSRLDMAKDLYGSVTDTENYFKVYEVFSFSSSKESLAAYVQSQPSVR